MSSIEYFLTRQIYGPNDHPQGWDKYIYDDENIHYGLLQTLMEDCPEFTKHLLNVPSMPIHVKVIPKPDNGTFDMLATVDGQPYYLEVKIWANLSEEQFSRQLEYIKAKKGQGCFVLFTKAADKWSPEIVSERSNNCCRVISRFDLQTALDAVNTFSSSELAEIAKAYMAVLQDIQRRWG